MSNIKDWWRQRQQKNVTVGEFDAYDFDTKAVDIIARMQDLVKEHGPDVYLDWDPRHHEPYDSNPSPTYWVKVIRPETDEEWNKRTAEHTEMLSRQEVAEREQYEKLKSKFGEK